jgi:DNA-binding GntR family transcriptional regulator
MAQGRTAVLAERLRDQVYRLIRDDLQVGVFEPGQRIVECDLADRYGVSRTPVREALMQLSQDGLVIESPERRYSVRTDSAAACADRHQVRQLLDPVLAREAALNGTTEQKRALAKALERQRAAHDAGDEPAFILANARFRERLRAMSGNAFLARCCAFADDQAQWERRRAFARADYRALELGFDERLVAAIAGGDADGAEAAMRDYVESTHQAH